MPCQYRPFSTLGCTLRTNQLRPALSSRGGEFSLTLPGQAGFGCLDFLLQVPRVCYTHPFPPSDFASFYISPLCETSPPCYSSVAFVVSMQPHGFPARLSPSARRCTCVLVILMFEDFCLLRSGGQPLRFDCFSLSAVGFVSSRF